MNKKYLAFFFMVAAAFIFITACKNSRGSSATVSALIEKLADKNVKVSEAALKELARVAYRDPKSIPMLIDALKHKNQNIRRHVAKVVAALSMPGQPVKEAIPGLIQMMQNDEKENRTVAVFALCKIGSEAVPALIGIFLTGDELSVQYAAFILSEIGTPSFPALIEALNSRISRMRFCAAYTLGAIGPKAKRAIPALTNLLKDEDARVRQQAEKTLKQIRFKR